MIDFYITEFIKKENEKYNLQKIGFIHNFSSECATLKSNINISYSFKNKNEFIIWRKQILDTFYLSKNFESFFHIHIIQNDVQRVVYSLFQQYLHIIKNEFPIQETDQYLAPEGQSLCYILDEVDFKKYIQTDFFNSLFPTATDVSKRCQQIIQQQYPLKFEQVIDHIRTNRPAFWKIFSIKLKNITICVTKSLLHTYNDDTVHDLWTDTGLDLRNYLNSERFNPNIGAKGLASFTAGIVKNKLYELFRKQKNDLHQWIENWDTDIVQVDLIDNDSITNDDEFIDISTIDFDNEQECQMALSCILCNENHPLYAQLTEGMEDKVTYMKEHYIDNKAYDEIVKRHFPTLNTNDQKKKCDKIRQDVTRIKTKLKERFYEILKNTSK